MQYIINNFRMNHKGSHPLIRNTYNFETAHQKQTKQFLKNQERPIQTTQAYLHTHPQQHKFSHSIQQLQSKIEGVQNMVKAKIIVSDSPTESEQMPRNKNIDKRPEGSKGKVLGSSLSGQDFRSHQATLKGQDFSPIRKSYRLPQPKKYSDQSPVKIPPLNLHSITSPYPINQNNPPSIASTTTSGSPPRKMSKKYQQSRSFMDLPPSDLDLSITYKLNNSFMTLLNQEEKGTTNSNSNEISLFNFPDRNKQQKQSEKERGMKISKTLSYLNIKNTINQMKNRSHTKKPTKNQIISGFQLGRVLGKGKFGQVYLARHLQTNFIVALKKIQKKKLQQLNMVNQFIQQVKLHSSLDHPTIVKFYALIQQKESFYLVLEYINGGTLFDYQNQVGILSPRVAVDFLKDIIDALIYLHDKSIAHRDIKPENIVISSNGIAKLCDFGWSAVIENVRSTFCGTLDYAPPEIIQRKTYDCTVDLWCIGILTYELFIGKAPFESQNRNQVMSRIVNIDKKGIPMLEGLPSDVREFVEALLQKDPAKRPKITQLYDFALFKHLSPSKQKKGISVK